MAGIFGLSVDPRKHRSGFWDDFSMGIFYQQHLGEEYAGFSITRGRGIFTQTHRGLVRSTFGSGENSFRGTDGIGYCGSDREPFVVESQSGEWSICFAGNIINRRELIARFKREGHIFEKRGPAIADVEIIAKLIAGGNSLFDGIDKMAKEIKGTYAILILAKNGVIAARSPDGHWPLVIGEKEGAIAVASESGGLGNLGFRLKRDIKPGEIIMISEGKAQKTKLIASCGIQICSFLWVYTAFANARFEGIPASLVRKRLGAALARRDIERGFMPDIVAPIPDSGRFHAIGYHQEFCRLVNERRVQKAPLYDELLLKYPHSRRSYPSQDKEARNREAHFKLLQSSEDYEGKVVVICEDSVVRGTQVKNNLVPKLRGLRVAEVHLRVSNPPLLSHCQWGKTTKRGECLAASIPDINERIKFLGVDSLRYNRIDDLVEAIGLPRELLCVDCDLPELTQG